MKPFAVLVGLVLAAAAGAVGGSLAASQRDTSTANAVLEPAREPASPAVTAVPPEVAARLDQLAMEVATLERRLAEVKQAEQRAPVAAQAATTATDAAAALSTDAFVALHGDAIRKVLADERAAEEKKREEERAAREVAQDQNRAARVAEQLGLSEGQKVLLADFYKTERQKMDEMRAQWRGGPEAGGPDTARDAFREAREWRSNELTRLFGTDLGGQIAEADGGRMRGAMAGRRGNGGGGGDAGAGPATPGGGAAPGGTDAGGQPGARTPRQRRNPSGG